MYQKYSDVIDKIELVENWIIEQLKEANNTYSVSIDYKDIIDSVNYPVIVLTQENLDFENGEPESLTDFKLSIKNKGSNWRINKPIIKNFLDIIENESLGDPDDCNAINININRIDHNYDGHGNQNVEITTQILFSVEN